MAKPGAPTDSYLEEVASLLVGPRRARRRLCAELRAHIDDAMRDATEELSTLERIGPPQEVARTWALRCERQRSRQGRRLALVVATAAIASFLALAQHAQGGQSVPRCSHQTAVSGTVSRAATAPSCRSLNSGSAR